MKLFELKSLIREAVIKIINESDEEITYTKDGKTHRIKRSSALAYPKDHPAYKAAMKNQGKKEPQKQAPRKVDPGMQTGSEKKKAQPDIPKSMQKMSPNQQVAAKNLLSKKGALGFTDHKIYQRQNEADLVLSKPIGKSGRFKINLHLMNDGKPIVMIDDKWDESGSRSKYVVDAEKKAGNRQFDHNDTDGIKKWMDAVEKHLSDNLKSANREF